MSLTASAPDFSRPTEPEASAPATPAPAPAQANTQWYLAKSGKDTCLPITEMHVGTHSIRTPEELAQAFRDMGQNARWDTTGDFGDRIKVLYVDPTTRRPRPDDWEPDQNHPIGHITVGSIYDGLPTEPARIRQSPRMGRG